MSPMSPMSDPIPPPRPSLTYAYLDLTIAPSPPEAYHSYFWFFFSFVLWIILHVYITPIYARVGDMLYHLWKAVQKMRGVAPSAASSYSSLSAGELPWGVRFTAAYNTLTPSKRAYWRRLFRAFLYYFFAVCFGAYFLLTYYHTIYDMYFIYTPGMDIAFCFAASHFLWCCVEDYPCRTHMGKSKCEQLAVFWGYIIHHVITAAAYLNAVQTQQLASMCLMGLTFEGPVFFGCLREIVSLYDEDFNLFERIPAWLLKLNWICAFVSLIPCRYVSVGVFAYSAWNWGAYLALVQPQVQAAFWTFGTIFLLINMYFTWLLTYWYRQDERYVKKKRAKKLQGGDANQQIPLLESVKLDNGSNGHTMNGHTMNGNGMNGHSSSSNGSTPIPNSSPISSPLSEHGGSPHPVQRHAYGVANGGATVTAGAEMVNGAVQIVTHK